MCVDGQVPALDAILDPPVDGESPDADGAYRVQWAGHDVVVRRYVYAGLFHSVGRIMKGSLARRAWNKGHRLLELGVPTPWPVACIDEYQGLLLCRSYLVTEHVDGRRIDELLKDPSVPSGVKRRVIRQVLKLIRRLNTHGIHHGDVRHTGVMCQDGRVVLTNLDGVAIHSLPWLHRRWWGRGVAGLLERILAWLAAGDGACEVNDATHTDDRRHHTPDFMSLSLPAIGGVLWVSPDVRDQEMEEALSAGPQALAERFQAEPVQSSQASRVWRFAAVFHGERVGVYLKEYLDRSALDRIKLVVRPDRAMRALRASRMLVEHGFRAPEVIAVGRGRASTVARRSTCFMITREVTDAVPIYNYLTPDPVEPAPCSLRQRRELLRQLGHMVGRMHSEGIVHGDLRPGNVLARRTDGRWEFFLLDNERTRRPLRLYGFLRRKNLVQINMFPRGVSRTDRLRFFCAYVLLNPLVCLHRRQWADRVMTVTHRRMRKKGWIV
ncbi:MAG: hypothetical protein JW955_11470 [Sedimentisphaerales bacterium]|nr:hypothetical protein [Sedimentisphaerales bacterium]